MTEYEHRLNILFSQLLNILEECEKILYTLCWEDGLLNESENSLHLRLIKLTDKAWKLIKEIEAALDVNKQLENTDSISKKIQRIIEAAAQLQKELRVAKRDKKLNSQDVSRYRDLLDNLHYLDKYVNTYNGKFDNKLSTIKQIKQKYNESIDDFFESIIAGTIKGDLQ